MSLKDTAKLAVELMAQGAVKPRPGNAAAKRALESMQAQESELDEIMAKAAAQGVELSRDDARSALERKAMADTIEARRQRRERHQRIDALLSGRTQPAPELLHPPRPSGAMWDQFMVKYQEARGVGHQAPTKLAVAERFGWNDEESLTKWLRDNLNGLKWRAAKGFAMTEPA